MLTIIERVLSDALRAGVSTDAWTWLTAARAQAARGEQQPLLDAYARAARHAGRAPLVLTAAELAQLAAAAPGIGFGRWTQDDAARALLLIARRTHGEAGPFVDAAVACFEQGDAREQQSWLRALPLWPEAAPFLPHAIEACRTNIVPVFEALACENPYPAAHFPERNFNQVVLKALFNTIALSRITGLASRLNTELSRMARDYAAERTAAGRTVPPDIGLAIGEPLEEPQ
jgi:hypothetical protein